MPYLGDRRDNIMKNATITKKVRTRLIETGTSKNDPQHVITITLDYSNVKDSEILAKAARTDIVTAQNKFLRKLSAEEYKELDGEVVDVVEFLGTSRSQVVKVAMTAEEQIAYVQGLPDDEKQDYLEKLKEIMLGAV